MDTLVEPRSADRGAALLDAHGLAHADTVAPGLGDGAPELPSSLAASSAAASSVGRVTVLPRVEMVGTEPRVVREARVRYAPERKLGEGGLGEVVGAVDQDIGRRVAVKRLKPDVRSEAALLRFADEVRTIGSLEHPNIIPIHDVGVDASGDHYFVMKYVDGETLEDVITKLQAGDPSYRARYTVERRVEIFIALLEAVAFAHARGVVHRDIKPANVMVGAYGEVVLMDWGIAKSLETVDAAELAPDAPPSAPRPSGPMLSSRAPEYATQVGGLLGTPLYMSPEQARGLPVDRRSDVYSLSMLFYELLGLKHPFAEKESLDQLLRAVADEPLPFLLDCLHPAADPVPVELMHFVKHGLAKNPARRFESVEVMLERLRARASGDIPIECPVTFVKSNTGRLTRFVEAHPFVATGAVAKGVLGFLSAAAMLVLLVAGVLHV
jgi:serine/threonine-protein kinase